MTTGLRVQFNCTLLLVLLLALPFLASAETSRVTKRARVSVTSSTTSKLVVDGILFSAELQVSDAVDAVPVWMCNANIAEMGDPPTIGGACTITSKVGCKKVYPGSLYVYDSNAWGGGVCAMLDTGSTAVLVDIAIQ